LFPPFIVSLRPQYVQKGQNETKIDVKQK